MTVEFDPRSSFLAELPFSHLQTDEGVTGEMDVTESLLVPKAGTCRISALASVADVITGVLTSTHTSPLLALTVDLAVRVLEPVTPGPLTLDSRVVKLGRSLSATQAWFRRDGELVAHAWATFMASPRPQDKIPGIAPNRGRGRREISEPFADALGLDVIERGIVEAHRTPYTLQPAGTIQGGVVCAMAELAAESLTGRPVIEIDVRYLSTIRIGPARAVAAPLGVDATEVTVKDAGGDGERVAAMAFTRA